LTLRQTKFDAFVAKIFVKWLYADNQYLVARNPYASSKLYSNAIYALSEEMQAWGELV